MKNYDLAENF